MQNIYKLLNSLLHMNLISIKVTPENVFTNNTTTNYNLQISNKLPIQQNLVPILNYKKLFICVQTNYCFSNTIHQTL